MTDIVFYVVADIAQKKKDGKLAPTSQKCKWNNPRTTKLSPKKAEDPSFRKHNFGKTAFSRTTISLISETDNLKSIRIR